MEYAALNIVNPVANAKSQCKIIHHNHLIPRFLKKKSMKKDQELIVITKTLRSDSLVVQPHAASSPPTTASCWANGSSGTSHNLLRNADRRQVHEEYHRLLEDANPCWRSSAADGASQSLKVWRKARWFSQSYERRLTPAAM